MTEISDLKRRVEAVGERFGRLAEQESRYGERLSGLLNAVEEGFARSQRETQALKSELATARDEMKKLTADLEAVRDEARQHRSELDAVKAERETVTSQLDAARDESRQLRGMLVTLLDAVEAGGYLDIGTAMRKLESRIDRIVTSTDGDPETAPAARLGGAAALPPPPLAAPAESEPARGDDDVLALTPKTRAIPEPPSAEALDPAPPAWDSPAWDSPASDSLASDSLAPEPPAAFDFVDIEAEDDDLDPEDEALDLDEAGVDLADVVEEVAAIAAKASAADGPEGSDEDLDFAAPEGSRQSEPPRKLTAIAGKTTEPPSDDDLSAVNKIIQRISLLTGEFVEPTHKRSGSDRTKSAAGRAVGGGPEEDDSPDDESAAKTK